MNAILKVTRAAFDLILDPIERMITFFISRDRTEAKDDPVYRQNVKSLIERNSAATRQDG